MPTPAITVSQYLELINFSLRTIPQDVVVEGEVVDFKVSQGKWVNFDLKDEKADAKISCFTTVYALNVPLESGMRIQVKGYAKVFERFGKLSLNIESVELVGEGALARAYEMLKNKLQAEGLFDIGRKRAVPRFLTRIGLITSAEAAAYGDFLRILGNRFGGLTVLHTPVHVQGQYAVGEILEAFATFNQLPEADRPEVIVLTRGGGSLEDLHAFNDEQVARAVYSSLVPVVVAVGHERDESLCDFVADIRASTPSNAAERLAPSRVDLEREVLTMTDRALERLQRHVERYENTVERSLSIFERSFAQIGERTRTSVTRLSHAFDRFRLSVVATVDHINRRRDMLLRNLEAGLERSQSAVKGLERILESVNPTKVLGRGYAIVRSGHDVVRDPSLLALGDRLSIQLAKGVLNAQVSSEKEQKRLF